MDLKLILVLAIMIIAGVVGGTINYFLNGKSDDEKSDFEIHLNSCKICQKRLEKEMVTFEQFFTKTYLPIAKINKSLESYKAEDIYFKKWVNPVIGKMLFKNICKMT